MARKLFWQVLGHCQRYLRCLCVGSRAGTTHSHSGSDVDYCRSPSCCRSQASRLVTGETDWHTSCVGRSFLDHTWCHLSLHQHQVYSSLGDSQYSSRWHHWCECTVMLSGLSDGECLPHSHTELSHKRYLKYDIWGMLCHLYHSGQNGFPGN